MIFFYVDRKAVFAEYSLIKCVYIGVKIMTTYYD